MVITVNIHILPASTSSLPSSATYKPKPSRSHSSGYTADSETTLTRRNLEMLNTLDQDADSFEEDSYESDG